MITSSNLSTIPFINFDDSTRLQMSSKQLTQSLTSINCEVPRIINKDWRYLTDHSKLFKYNAEYDGELIYRNDLILVIYQNHPNTDKQLLVLPIPPIQTTTGIHSVRLRYVRDYGPFSAGDLIYEYDSFKFGMPVYGYNANVLYMNFFGYTHEDAVVVSESFAKKTKSTKLEKIILPVYSNSLYKTYYANTTNSNIYFPTIGQRLNGNILAVKAALISNKVSFDTLKLLDPITLTTAIDSDNLKYYTVPELTRIKNGTVVDIKVHLINKLKFVDRNLEKVLNDMYCDYGEKIRDTYTNLESLFNSDFARQVLSRYYVMRQRNMKELAYLVEFQIAQEKDLGIGDKISNRHANKGVVSLILPDELCPVMVNLNRRIDVIQTYMSVMSRMNLGQLIEGLSNKIIVSAEDQIVNDDNYAVLSKLSDLSRLFNDFEYSDSILRLYDDILTDKSFKDRFRKSISNLGLYFEVDGFAQCNIQELINFADSEFNVSATEPIRIPKETFKYMRDTLGLTGIDLPKTDVIYNDLFSGNIYINKLMHEADSKITVRDFGSYKKTTSQPIQGRLNGGSASRIGNMEFESLISAGCLNIIKELRTVKSDERSSKSQLVSQIVSTGKYNLPDKKGQSKTKLIIDSLIKFIHS